MHQPQVHRYLFVRGFGEHGDQIDIADARIEVRARQGPEDVQTNEGGPNDGQDRLLYGTQHRGGIRIERRRIFAHAAT